MTCLSLEAPHPFLPAAEGPIPASSARVSMLALPPRGKGMSHLLTGLSILAKAAKGAHWTFECRGPWDRHRAQCPVRPGKGWAQCPPSLEDQVCERWGRRESPRKPCLGPHAAWSDGRAWIRRWPTPLPPTCVASLHLGWAPSVHEQPQGDTRTV